MSIAPFPHHYSVRLDDNSLQAGERPRITGGAPPQFGGSDKMWSPEELLVSAVVLCLKTTFDAYAKREALGAYQFHADATGMLEKSRAGPLLSSVRQHVDLIVDQGAEEKAKELLLRAERDCIIARSIKATVSLTFAVTASPSDAREPNYSGA